MSHNRGDTMSIIDIRRIATLAVCPLLTAALIAPVSAQEYVTPIPLAKSAELSLKRKVAIGRFTNETRYGQSILRDSNLDPLGKQAADILAAYLVQSGNFMVFERGDLNQIAGEQNRLGDSAQNMIGVDTLILGSIVEFGRSEDGKRG